MKIHRFFVEQNLNERILSVDNKDFLHQVKNVLQLRPGEKIILFNGDGFNYEGEIDFFDKRILRFSKIKKEINQVNSCNQVRLYCAILKKENFELVAQKATEVGVTEIIPLITDRTVKLSINFDRLGKIIKEAAEQSGRSHIPLLRQPVGIKKAVENFNSDDLNLYFDTVDVEEKPPVVKNKKVNIFIGPEGGWTEEERALFGNKRVAAVTLGRGIMRAETAAIVASYLMAN